MPTAVLDLELQNLPAEITGLNNYSKAYILGRFHGIPVGKIEIPVHNGRLVLEEYGQHLLEASGTALLHAFINHYLNWEECDTKDFTPPTATVAICTRNRTDDLKRCLDALMKLPDDGQEILVVDNCPSTNETKVLVENYPRVRYVCEPLPGLDRARNRAMKEAKNEIVAFTDDDATPDKSWLRALVRNFNSPVVACVTGITMPLELETEAQEAFERYNPFNKGFRRIVFSANTHNPLNTGQVGAGASMAIRKSILTDVGPFDEALDSGTATQSGGDHEYFARILVHGFQIVYEPAALSWHRHRRTWKETVKAINGYGIGVYAFWTRILFIDKQINILKMPYGWFLHVQLPNLIKSVLQRPGSQPLALIISELKGCLVGPWAYFKARRNLVNK